MADDARTEVRFSHVGICVNDVGQSLAFYCEALGFERTDTFNMSDGISKITELPDPIDLQAEFLRRGNFVLELLYWKTPTPEGSLERRALNQYGLTHLAFAVDDVDSIAQRVEAFGGKVLRQTRTVIPEGDHLYCTDPNGVRIELIRLTDSSWFDKVH